MTIFDSFRYPISDYMVPSYKQEYIPKDIIIEIFLLLTDIEFVIISRVCKTWHIILNSFYKDFRKKPNFIGRAAKLGYLNVIKWARENGCPWDDRVCSTAALKGYLNIVIWARENGCSWNNRTCENAARQGHLEVLKWARENGCPEKLKKIE